MLPLLAWLPAATSLILGIVYLYMGDARPVVKLVGVVVFLTAVYLQFFSPYSLFGLLLQIVLALLLALWQRSSTAG
jgi:hypothetical protein